MFPSPRQSARTACALSVGVSASIVWIPVYSDSRLLSIRRGAGLRPPQGRALVPILPLTPRAAGSAYGNLIRRDRSLTQTVPSRASQWCGESAPLPGRQCAPYQGSRSDAGLRMASIDPSMWHGACSSREQPTITVAVLALRKIKAIGLEVGWRAGAGQTQEEAMLLIMGVIWFMAMAAGVALALAAATSSAIPCRVSPTGESRGRSGAPGMEVVPLHLIQRERPQGLQDLSPPVRREPSAP